MFDKIKSIEVLKHDNKSCGNTGHLCNALVKLSTTTGDYKITYEALRNISVIIETFDLKLRIFIFCQCLLGLEKHFKKL